LLSRHPLVAYFLIAFLGTWLLDLPMVLGQDGLGLLGYHVPIAVYAVLFILSAYTGPTLGAVLVTASLDGRLGLRYFFRRYAQWRVGIRWYLIALVGTPLVYLISAAIWQGFAPFKAVLSNWGMLFTIYLPAVLVFPALITWGEEPGWRGFALTRMQVRYRPIIASLVVGFFHGIWHLPIFLLVNGPVASGPFHLGSFLINTLGIMIISVVWAWVFNNAAGSILMAVLLHAAFNASQAWIGKAVPNYPPQGGYTAIGIFLACAVIITIVTRGNLGYRPVWQDQSR
jgi:membrane protease YdiL (CAAX protease family)